MTVPRRFPPPSGEQFEITHGSQQAVITEVGATLRAYRADGVEILDGFGAEELATGGRGRVLAPWPNRLGDGRYTFDGTEVRVALNEPERSNAIHGLVRWLPWSELSRSESAVALGCVVHPQPAYPWRLGLRLKYSLGDAGMTGTAEATNLTEATAPFGIGFRPYLTVGTPIVDRARLVIPACRRLLSDERGLPSGETALAGTDYDFNVDKAIGAIALDTAYTGLSTNDRGRVTVELASPDGDRRVALWADAAFLYLMAFTGDTLAPQRRRRSIALEPMTCPPDALRSGRDLIRLGPGDKWVACWGISAHLRR